MSDDEVRLVLIFWGGFSIVGIAGMLQSHAMGPFSAIVCGIIVGAILTGAAAALCVLIWRWWFWAGTAAIVAVGCLHELMGW